ncbi:hexose carrier protein HEX6-like [Dendrobium catenatum]|uniref:Hexose carrier protein HEX6 n=1 Tax=Dendrobium catenatum TaxID=906689 RepID=A0A2I0XIK3_9ASPA|nr:hexose carrier protein HEX6-like [Dendrobium catenatum]PKU87728.1 Hexose carrier protein HEX6 [Dendrobium catenatum]
MVTTCLENKLLGGDEEKFTPFLLFSCLVASSGGLLFGYDLGISGGVTSTESFLKQFFPGVYTAMKQDANISNYCKFDSQLLTLFTSSLYFAGLFASLFSSQVTNRLGCRFSMRTGGAFFFAGAIIGAAAINVHMLILSRLLLGFGVGFTNQTVPLYLSEMAPARYRGAIFNVFEMCINGGILLANLINYGTQKIEAGWGWRLSLGLAAIPATVLTAGAFFISDTPTGIFRLGGDLQEASRVLQKIRGTTDITKELDDLVAATARASSAAATQHPLRRIIRRNYRPQLVMALILPIFQQLTGINLVTYYAPTMFRSVGLEESASLLSSLITRLTATACNLVAMAFVDRFGRRKFFFFGGIQMFVSQVVVGVIMAAKLGDHGVMSREYAKLMLLFLSLYVAGFGWSWGPLPWLVSEMFPLEIRSVGQSIVVMAGFLFNAVIAQSLLLMLCHMKWGIFFFFAGWVLLMTVFVFLFLPETTGMPLERIGRVWRGHWYWKKFVESVEDKEPAEVNVM